MICFVLRRMHEDDFCFDDEEEEDSLTERTLRKVRDNLVKVCAKVSSSLPCLLVDRMVIETR